MPVTFAELLLSNGTFLEAKESGKEFEEQLARFCLVKGE